MNNTTSLLQIQQKLSDLIREERDKLSIELQESISREEESETVLKEAQEIIANNLSLITSSNKVKVMNNIQKLLKN